MMTKENADNPQNVVRVAQLAAFSVRNNSKRIGQIQGNGAFRTDSPKIIVRCSDFSIWGLGRDFSRIKAGKRLKIKAFFSRFERVGSPWADTGGSMPDPVFL
jgi:hypothetical protein